MPTTDLKKRCPTGIIGLDELIEGGFPRQRSMLISGTCGSGKTTFAIQFLYKGITDYNEPGILISLEQDPRELKADMMNYGFDLQKEEDAGKLIIIDASLSHVGVRNDSLISTNSFKDPEGSMSLLPDQFNLDNILDLVVAKARKIGAKRVVLDSLPALEFLVGDASEAKMKNTLRHLLLVINSKLKASGLTTLLITEIHEDEGEGHSTHGIESYVTDGAINMYYTQMGMASGRTMIIRKMRGTQHSEDVHPIAFKRGMGLVVQKPADAMKDALRL